MWYHWSYIYVALNHWCCPRFWCMWNNFDGFVQDCSISSALALKILQSCTKLSIWPQERLTTAHISIRWWCCAYDNAFQVLLWYWWGNVRETQHWRINYVSLASTNQYIQEILLVSEITITTTVIRFMLTLYVSSCNIMFRFVRLSCIWQVPVRIYNHTC